MNLPSEVPNGYQWRHLRRSGNDMTETWLAHVLRSRPPANDACSGETDHGSGGIPTIGFNAVCYPKPRQRTRDVNATVGGKDTAHIGNINASQTQGKEHQTAGSDQAPPGRCVQVAAKSEKRSGPRSQRMPPSKKRRLFALAYGSPLQALCRFSRLRVRAAEL